MTRETDLHVIFAPLTDEQAKYLREALEEWFDNYAEFSGIRARLNTHGGPVATVAFELVRLHGFLEAQEIAQRWRDAHPPGSVGFILHDTLCEQLVEFARIGSLYRPASGWGGT
jgi:hypothetical protein